MIQCADNTHLVALIEGKKKYTAHTVIRVSALHKSTEYEEDNLMINRIFSDYHV